MEIEEYKNINYDVIIKMQDFFNGYNMKFKIYLPITENEDITIDHSIVVSFCDNILWFENFKEVYESFKPVLKVMRDKEQEEQFRQRVLRDALIEGVNEVANRFSKVVYTMSIGKPENKYR